MVGLKQTRRGATMALAIVMTSAGGCQMFAKKERPPLAAPKGAVTVTHYAGSALSGPQAREVTSTAIEQAWSIDARVIAVEQLPSDGFESLAPKARLIVASRGGTPVSASARLTPGLLTRRVPGEFDLASILGDPATQVQVAQESFAVAPGTTADLRVGVESDPKAIVAAARTAVTIRLTRPTWGEGKYEIALASEELIPTVAAAPADKPQDPAAVRFEREQEMLVIDQTLEAPADRLLLVVPLAFTDTNAKGVVIDLTIRSADIDAAKRSAMANRLQQDVITSADAIRQRTAITTGSAEEVALGSALAGLAQAGDEPRGALAYLANASGASLTEAVVLVADAPLLQQIGRAVSEASAGLQKRDRANVGWLLDRTTMAAVAASANDQKAPLTPAVYGALASFAGEVGRQLDALKAAVDRSNGAKDLNNRLVAENQIYLEDGSPAVRVRAYDWLNQRGLAPTGYDPLGTARDRRVALERASNPSTQPTTKP